MHSFRGPSIVEREQLHEHKSAILSGFQPRRIRQLAIKHPPRNDTNIDCCHILRSQTWRLPGYVNLDQGQRLWAEVSNHLPDFPEADVTYDSNHWRNFRISEMGDKEHTLNEIIALANPVKLPAPSKLGKYTYASYLVQTNIGPNDSFKRKLIADSHKQDENNRLLKLQSDIRNPPIDYYGNIKPPKGFKKHANWKMPVCLSNENANETTSVVKQPTRVWRLSYCQNTPNHKLIQTARRSKSQHSRKVIHSLSLLHGIH